MAVDFLPQMKKVDKFPVPQPGMTCFYIVTQNGVFTYTGKEVDFGQKRDKLSKLFYQGHELIGQMRLAEENG